jgi:mannose-6-phosphate isomerase
VEKIKNVLNKPITSKITGESWGVVEGDVSVIANGDLKGKTEVINEVPNEGTEVYKRFGKQFPLLLNI